MSGSRGWVGVDLDGTLAVYDHWRGVEHIGDPIAPMVERVKAWLEEGREVRIMTARVYFDGVLTPSYENAMAAKREIENWCQGILGRKLPVTCTKDYGMIELWDDRAVQVIPNTGERADAKEEVASLLNRIRPILHLAMADKIKGADGQSRKNVLACRIELINDWFERAGLPDPRRVNLLA